MLPARTARRGWLAVIDDASTLTKLATMAIRAFAIRKARRYLQRDGEWLTEEATDDMIPPPIGDCASCVS